MDFPAFLTMIHHRIIIAVEVLARISQEGIRMLNFILGKLK